ncbi:hypothetical protein [Vibrio alginolyticus]|uniref:hypothetical protein n=1 Tax=Vibrio alginolyticus TaxID=663 RepID=UPI00375221AB
MSMLRYDHTKIAESLVNYSEVSLLRILAGKQDSNYSVIPSDSLKNIYYITAAWKYLREGFCTEERIIEALSQYPSGHMIVYGVSGDQFKLPLHHAVSYVINTMCQPILTPTEEKEFKVVLELAGK